MNFSVIQYKASLLIIAINFWMITCNTSPIYGDTLPKPVICKWYLNKKAAVSFRFDDNLESHKTIVVPLLNKYDIDATFMVSPGRRSYKRNEKFWAEQVPAMGHELGNHTMHHRGARTIDEAKYEIGEASRIIRNIYSDPDKLLVFASGGGKSWGGKRWSEADVVFRDIAKKYKLIDLYDGTHSFISIDNKTTLGKLSEAILDAVKNEKHQALNFHNVGKPRIKDWIKRIVYGYSLSFPVDEFQVFLKILVENDDLWVAPLGDIIKYESQFNGTHITDLKYDQGEMSFRISTDVDPDIYNHPMTIAIDLKESPRIVLQNNKKIEYRLRGDTLFFDIMPINSVVDIKVK